MTNRILNVVAFAILAGLWLVFLAALIFDRELLRSAWARLLDWPLVVQIVIWLLTLPAMLGLWMWQTSWPLVLRLVLVAGLAWATLYAFFPWKKSRRPDAAKAAS